MREKEICFILSPFKEPFDTYYREILRPAANDAGLIPQRADEIYGARTIMKDIWESIRTCRMALSEMTGRNPNVLYEVGLCHAIGKPVVMITQTMDDIPFDLKGFRCIVYQTEAPNWAEELRRKIKETIFATLKDKDAGVIFSPHIRDFFLYRELKHQKGYIENILQTLSSGVITINKEEKVTIYNQCALNILKMEDFEIKNKDLRNLPSLLGDMLFESMTTGRTYEKTEVALLPPNLLLEVTTYQINDRDGESIGSVMIFDDISSRKQLPYTYENLELIKRTVSILTSFKPFEEQFERQLGSLSQILSNE